MAPSVLVCTESMNGSRNLIAQGDAPERKGRRRMHFVGEVTNLAGAFEHIFVVKFARNQRSLGGLTRHQVDDVTCFQFGDVDAEHPAVGIIDIFGHLTVVNRFLGIGGHIHRNHLAIRLDHFEVGNRHSEIRQHKTEGKGPIIPPALLGQHFDEGFILTLAGAINPVNAHGFSIHGGAVTQLAGNFSAVISPAEARTFWVSKNAQSLPL